MRGRVPGDIVPRHSKWPEKDRLRMGWTSARLLVSGLTCYCFYLTGPHQGSGGDSSSSERCPGKHTHDRHRCLLLFFTCLECTQPSTGMISCGRSGEVGDSCPLHFTVEETKDQRARVTYPRSHSSGAHNDGAGIGTQVCQIVGPPEW